MNKENLIPTLNFELYSPNYLDVQNRHLFVKQLKYALTTTGFFFLKNHGMDEAIIKMCEKLAKDFFALPLDVKLQYEDKVNHQGGYTPSGVEAGEHAQKTPDEKEFFQLGDRYAPMVHDVKDFTTAHIALFNEFRKVYVRLLRAVSLSLGLDEYYFDPKIDNSIVRTIYYPAKQNPLHDDNAATQGGNAVGMCASRHTDINFLTLLLAREKGLQLWHENAWYPITISDPNVMIINCGDMLNHFTGGKYISGEHRVVCQPDIERYSVPFFGHIGEKESIKPLEHLFPDYDKKKYYFNTAGEYLLHRLIQIGLVKA